MDGQRGMDGQSGASRDRWIEGSVQGRMDGQRGVGLRLDRARGAVGGRGWDISQRRSRGDLPALSPTQGTDRKGLLLQMHTLQAPGC